MVLISLDAVYFMNVKSEQRHLTKNNLWGTKTFQFYVVLHVALKSSQTGHLTQVLLQATWDEYMFRELVLKKVHCNLKLCKDIKKCTKA